MSTTEAVYVWNTYRTLDCQKTGVSLKATPGQVGGWYLSNQAAALRYVKLYDTNQVPDNTFTPKITIALPANSAANLLSVSGIDFTQGIAVRGTTGLADNDNTAPTANDIIANIFYK
jgi:hypothetical protein